MLGASSKRKAGIEAELAKKGIGGAKGKGAALLAFVEPGGVVRSKGVQNVTHPGVGIYWIEPKSGQVDISRAVPVVSVEWGQSIGNGNLAQWNASNNNCPSDTFEVLTFAIGSGGGGGGGPQVNFSNDVAFTFLVP